MLLLLYLLKTLQGSKGFTPHNWPVHGTILRPGLRFSDTFTWYATSALGALKTPDVIRRDQFDNHIEN